MALLNTFICAHISPLVISRRLTKGLLRLALVLGISTLTCSSILAQNNTTKIDGTTPLMQAIYERDTEVAFIAELIAAGANISASNRYGVTPIFLAARRGETEVMRLLLNAGANPRSTNPESETVLMTAAKTGNAEILEMLLSGTEELTLFAAADPNAIEGWKGQTALMWAAALGHHEAVNVLVAHGADLDQHSAFINIATVDANHFQGGFVYSRLPRGRMTALHFAVRQGQYDSVKTLIELGADIDILEDDGVTPLLMATVNGHMDIAGLLLDSGADPNISDKWGRTVLFIATDMHTIDANPRPAPLLVDTLTSVDIVKLALAKGAKPGPLLTRGLPAWATIGGDHNPILQEGSTPFFRSVMSGDLELMAILIAAGADPTLGTAEREGRVNGDGETTPTNGDTSVFMAAAGVGWRPTLSRGREIDAITTMKMLMDDYGADINGANQYGTTALHGAVVRASEPIIRFLAENGANFNAEDHRGLTPLDIATGQPEFSIEPNDEIAGLLRELNP